MFIAKKLFKAMEIAINMIKIIKDNNLTITKKPSEN